jgi:hypothetical protein
VAERAVITGVGPVSALGVGPEAFATNAGRISSVADDPPPAAIEGFDVKGYLKSKQMYLDRHSELVLGAVALALADAGLADEASLDRGELGLAVGTAYGNYTTADVFMEKLFTKGPKFVPPLLFTHAYPNSSASLAAIEFSTEGPCLNFAGLRSAGLAAVAEAAALVAAGKARAVVAGGADAVTERLTAGLAASGSLGPFVEGAGFVVVESAASASGRGAECYLEITLATYGALRLAEGDGTRAVFDDNSQHEKPTRHSIDAGSRDFLRRHFGDVDPRDIVGPPPWQAVSICKRLGDSLAATAPLGLIALALSAEAPRGTSVFSSSDWGSIVNLFVEKAEDR